VGRQEKMGRTKAERLREKVRMRNVKVLAFLIGDCCGRRHLFLQPQASAHLRRDLFAQRRNGKPARSKRFFEPLLAAELPVEKAELTLDLRRIDYFGSGSPPKVFGLDQIARSESGATAQVCLVNPFSLRDRDQLATT
jgi:hypothetical protein